MLICLNIQGPDLIINCINAPNGRHEHAKREAWYADLAQLPLESNRKLQITAGYMNARFHFTTNDDPRVGKSVFGRGDTFLKHIYLPDLTNRI